MDSWIWHWSSLNLIWTLPVDNTPSLTLSVENLSASANLDFGTYFPWKTGCHWQHSSSFGLYFSRPHQSWTALPRAEGSTPLCFCCGLGLQTRLLPWESHEHFWQEEKVNLVLPSAYLKIFLRSSPFHPLPFSSWQKDFSPMLKLKKFQNLKGNLVFSQVVYIRVPE